MNHLLKSNLDRINNQGVDLSFDQILDQGFKSWKKITLPVAGVYFIFAIFIPLLFLALMPLIYGVSMGEFMDVAKDNPEYFQQHSMSTSGFIGIQVFTLIVMLAFTPISVGVMKMAYSAMVGKPVVFSDVFTFYKAPYFVRLIGFSLLFSFLPSLLIGAIALVFPPLAFASYFVNILVAIFLIFSPGLIAFGDASIMDAVKISLKVATQKVGLIIGILLISVLFQLLGAMACCIGMLFTISFLHSLQMSMYREIFMRGDMDNVPESSLE